MTLRVENLSKTFGRIVALRSVSFTVEEGEVVGFVGPNGAGKSTTMRVILGMIDPDGGSVSADSSTPKGTRASYFGRVAGCVDAPARYPTLTARQHLQYIARLSGERDPRKVTEALRHAGLADDDKRASQFSTGMKQRLAIAMCLVGSPKYLVLDEPTSGLDPVGAAEFRTLVRSLAKVHGMGLLISSHLLNEMERICDRVVAIRQGSIIADQRLSGPAPDRMFIRASDRGRLFELLSATSLVSNCHLARDGVTAQVDPSRTAELAELIVRSGVGLLEFSPEIGSLEEEYLTNFGEGRHIP